MEKTSRVQVKPGIQREVLIAEGSLLQALIIFDRPLKDTLHSHPHEQCTYDGDPQGWRVHLSAFQRDALRQQSDSRQAAGHLHSDPTGFPVIKKRPEKDVFLYPHRVIQLHIATAAFANLHQHRFGLRTTSVIHRRQSP